MVSKELKERSHDISTSAKSCACPAPVARRKESGGSQQTHRAVSGACLSSSSTASFYPTLPTLSRVALVFQRRPRICFANGTTAGPGSRSGCVFWEAPGHRQSWRLNSNRWIILALEARV